MAKKHRRRPALNAADVWRWLFARIPLEIEPIKGTPAFIITKGKNVRQRWTRRRQNGGIASHTAVTYLGLGIILVPRWYEVPDWRAQHLRAQGIADRIHGYATFEGQLCELRYQQVEDLDHCRRQQDHILRGYDMPKRKDLVPTDFNTMIARLERVANITRHVAGRKIGADSLYTIIRSRLASHRRSLRSFVENAPTLKGDTDMKKQRVLIAALQKMANECQGFACRPIVRQVHRSIRSITLAVKHIERGERLDLARACIRSAIRNLEYPVAPVATDQTS